MNFWRPIDFDNVVAEEQVGVKEKNENEVMILSSSESEEENNLGVRGKNLQEGAKKCIISCYEVLKSENHPTPRKRTAELLQYSYNTIKKVLREQNYEKVKSPKKKFTRVTDGMKEAIVSKIYGSYARNFVPTVKSVYEELIEDGINIPYKMTQFTALICDMGFSYKKLNRRQYIMESERIVRLRVEYLAKIDEYRRQGRNIVFLDETWFDTHDVKVKGMTDRSPNCILKTPPSRGKRVIILHAGGENGWVQNALLISAKNIKNCNADYHEEMTAALFEEWCEKQLFPNLAPGTVIVMDNAPSHSRLSQKIPNTSTRKSEIIEFLHIKNISIPPEVNTKKKLLELVSQHQFQKVYAVDQMAETSGFVCLRLPPYFCIFNPIELIWSDLKRNVRKYNSHPESSPAVINVIRQQAELITPQKWQNCINHVKKIELTFTKTPPANIIININNDSSSESESE